MSAPLRSSVAFGDMVIVSGAIGNRDDDLVGPDVADQTTQTLANLAETLAGHGLGLGDIVKTTVFLTDIRDFDAMNAAYAAAFGDDEYPARSTVAVAQLPSHVAKVEIEAIAYRGGAE